MLPVMPSVRVQCPVLLCPGPGQLRESVVWLHALHLQTGVFIRPQSSIIMMRRLEARGGAAVGTSRCAGTAGAEIWLLVGSGAPSAGSRERV